MDKKRSFEQELELSIYKLFREKLSEEFDIQVEQRLDSKKRPDIAISKGDKRLEQLNKNVTCIIRNKPQRPVADNQKNDTGKDSGAGEKK